MKTKQDVIHWLQENQSRFTKVSDEIWANPEVAFQEFKASRLQADFLQAEGFRITWDIGGLNTAFVAEWGEGKPVIGFAGEYDALAGLSQKNQPTQEPLIEGGPGHGCGHNLLGTGCMAAAVALRRWLDATGREGTVRYYGCPAEERITGKTFMARAGAFEGLDAAFNFHPSRLNYAQKGSSIGAYDLKFRFHGRASHAGGSPHLGRSALDAVELMNIGVNYLREHVTSNVRMHYVITHGGDLPNVVPAEAEVWYFVRAYQATERYHVANRVRRVAQGAAMMTETTVDEIFNGACSSVLNNAYLADLQYEAMQVVGPIPFTDEEKAYAHKINDGYPLDTTGELFKNLKLPPEVEERVGVLKREPLLGENFPSLDEGVIRTGSTDVGDLSWITPLSMLRTACWPAGVSAHSWGIVAASAMSIGHKGMMHAAKIMALAAIDLCTDPEHLRKARQEFERATKGQPYRMPLPDHVKPPRYEMPG